LTDSGRFSHKVVKRPSISLAQNKESPPANTDVLTTMLRHQLEFERDITLGIMPGKRRQGGQKKPWTVDIVQWGKRSLVEMVRQARQKRLPVLSS